MKKVFAFVESNPVVVLDIVKYGVALLALFGVGLPAGFAVTATALLTAVLSLVTRSLVTPVNGSTVSPVGDGSAASETVDSGSVVPVPEVAPEVVSDPTATQTIPAVQ